MAQYHADLQESLQEAQDEWADSEEADAIQSWVDRLDSEELIEAAIREVIKQPERPLNQECLNQVTWLVICAEGLKDISQIGKLINLESLILSRNDITDLEPLTNLVKLKFLSLDDNKNINDLTPVSKLKSLEELELSGCCLEDVSALSELEDLRNLGLPANLLTTTRSLSSLKNLERLNLDYNIFLKDLDGLSELKKLTYLSLDETEKLPESEIEKIKASLPDCEISR